MRARNFPHIHSHIFKQHVNVNYMRIYVSTCLYVYTVRALLFVSMKYGERQCKMARQHYSLHPTASRV